jgi:hypothetical protein
MVEQAHATLLDRTTVPRDISTHFSSQLVLLDQMVNYGSNLIIRAFNNSDQGLRDIVVCGSLLKQFTSALDACGILIREGALHSAQMPARAAFEASVYVEWMLISHGEKKATHFFVRNLRRRLLWANRVTAGTADAGEFMKDMGELGADVLKRRPEIVDIGNRQRDEVSKILERPEFIQTNRRFEELASNGKRRREPEWYVVLGKPSLRSIAKELRRLPEYELVYARGSEVMHGGSYTDQLSFSKGGMNLLPIRNLNGITNLFTMLFSMAVVTFQRVIVFYRNRELPAFQRMYVDEWRVPFLSVPKVAPRSPAE